MTAGSQTNADGDRQSFAAPLAWSADALLDVEEHVKKTCFELDRYDGWHFSRLKAHDPDLFVLLRQKKELIPLALDLYALLFKPQPRLKTHGGRSTNRSLIAHLAQRSDLRSTLNKTRLNECSTVLALRPFIESLADSLTMAKRSEASSEVASAFDDISAAKNDAPTDNESSAETSPKDAEFEKSLAGFQAQLNSQAPLARHMTLHKAGARAVHRLLDAYERTIQELAAFDANLGLAKPDDDHQRPTRRGPRPLSFLGRRTQQEPSRELRHSRVHVNDVRRWHVEEMRTARSRAQQALETWNGIKAEAERAIESGQDESVNAAVEKSRAQIAEMLATIDQVLALFAENDRWGRDPGDGLDIPLEDVVRYGQLLRNNQSLKQIVELAGRWSITLKRKFPRGKAEGGRSELLGVCLGGDLENVLPTELVYLRQPALRRLTLARIAERRALSKQLVGPHLLGRGPVIVAVDASGSMSGARITLAKSLLLAIALRCMAKNRPMHVLTFGGPTELEQHTFTTRVGFWNRLRQCLDMGFGGGTSFDLPLLEICKISGSKPWCQADAVFITDGECFVSEQALERLAATKREHYLQVIGVKLAVGRGLDAAADVMFELDSPTCLADDQKMEPLLKRVAGRL